MPAIRPHPHPRAHPSSCWGWYLHSVRQQWAESTAHFARSSRQRLGGSYRPQRWSVLRDRWPARTALAQDSRTVVSQKAACRAQSEAKDRARRANPGRVREVVYSGTLMTTPHWTERFNGLPYAPDGTGPEAFNCWFFFAHVQREQFGVDVDMATGSPVSLSQIARTFRQQLASSGWRKVEKSEGWRSGDGVLMAHFRYPSHVGIYVDDVGGGSVLHCSAGQGSALHTLFHLEIARWRIAGVYRRNIA